MEIQKHFHDLIFDGLGLSQDDPNLIDTPKRLERMYLDLFKNVGKEFKGMTSFPNTEKYDQIVLMDNMHFTSVCSHHFLPFSGKAWFAYLPDKRLMGASKAARVIAHYAAQPQLQENLCQQVVNFIENELQPKGIMLVMRAIHGCMSCRGVYQYAGAGMVTSSIRGSFKDAAARSEVMDLIKMSIMMEK